MNKILIAITIAVLVSGCSSMQHTSKISPAERHQAAKTKYYEDLNQGRFNAQNEVDGKSERAPVEL